MLMADDCVLTFGTCLCCACCSRLRACNFGSMPCFAALINVVALNRLCLTDFVFGALAHLQCLSQFLSYSTAWQCAGTGGSGKLARAEAVDQCDRGCSAADTGLSEHGHDHSVGSTLDSWRMVAHQAPAKCILHMSCLAGLLSSASQCACTATQSNVTAIHCCPGVSIPAEPTLLSDSGQRTSLQRKWSVNRPHRGTVSHLRGQQRCC